MGFLDSLSLGDKIQSALGSVFSIVNAPIDAVVTAVGMALGDEPKAASQQFFSGVSQAVTDTVVYASRGVDKVFGTNIEPAARDALTELDTRITYYGEDTSENARPLTTFERIDLQQELEEARQKAIFEQVYADSDAREKELQALIAEYDAAMDAINRGEYYMTEKGLQNAGAETNIIIQQVADDAGIQYISDVTTPIQPAINRDAMVQPNITLRRRV